MPHPAPLGPIPRPGNPPGPYEPPSPPQTRHRVRRRIRRPVLAPSAMYPGMMSWQPAETCAHGFHGAMAS